MDPQALRHELERLHEESYQWAVHCCRNDHAMAQDALQNAYLKVLDGRAQFREQSAFKTWFFAVVRNCAADERRRALLRRFTLLEEDHAVTDELANNLESDESAQILRSHLQQLPRRQQDVLLLVFYHDLSLSETAEVLALSVGSVRTHYERGKQRLRTLLKDLHDQ